jgi:hypothetical protein
MKAPSPKFSLPQIIVYYCQNQTRLTNWSCVQLPRPCRNSATRNQFKLFVRNQFEIEHHFRTSRLVTQGLMPCMKVAFWQSGGSSSETKQSRKWDSQAHSQAPHVRNLFTFLFLYLPLSSFFVLLVSIFVTLYFFQQIPNSALRVLFKRWLSGRFMSTKKQLGKTPSVYMCVSRPA